MKKVDLIYLVYKLGAIASFTIGINIAMNEKYKHPYILGVVVALFGVLGLLKASDMEEKVSKCLLHRLSLWLYTGEMLVDIGFSVFSLGVFYYVSFHDLQTRALLIGLIGMVGGGFLYFYICKTKFFQKKL